jgi:hypothetical protein
MIPVAPAVPPRFPVTPLPVAPALPPAAPVIDPVTAARIIIAVIPAGVAAAITISRPAIISVIIIAAAAIIAGPHAHPAIAIAVVIGASAQRQRTRKADRGQKLSSGPQHRLISSCLETRDAMDNAARLNWL